MRLNEAGCGNISSSKATKSNRTGVMHILFSLVLVLALSCTTSLTSTNVRVWLAAKDYFTASRREKVCCAPVRAHMLSVSVVEMH